MWLTKLKIAIIEKDADALDKLLDNVPKFSSLKEIEESLYLLNEASQLVYILQARTLITMKQIKKNIQFLRSTDIPTSKKLDITS